VVNVLECRQRGTHSRFTSVIVLTLGLAVGFNVALFTVLNWRRTPIGDGTRLATRMTNAVYLRP
jgi:hypothetical protein